MSKFWTFVLLSSLAFYGCKSKKEACQNFESSYISLERTPCYGTCPVYKVKLEGNGKAQLTNTRFVDPIGDFTGTISEQDVDELFQLFKNTDWQKFKDSYDANVSDLPTIKLVWYHSGYQKQISIRAKHPAELDVLISKVDQVKDKIAWNAPAN